MTNPFPTILLFWHIAMHCRSIPCSRTSILSWAVIRISTVCCCIVCYCLQQLCTTMLMDSKIPTISVSYTQPASWSFWLVQVATTIAVCEVTVNGVLQIWKQRVKYSSTPESHTTRVVLRFMYCTSLIIATAESYGNICTHIACDGVKNQASSGCSPILLLTHRSFLNRKTHGSKPYCVKGITYLTSHFV